MFHFVRNCRNLLHSDCTVFCSLQEWVRVPIASRPHSIWYSGFWSFWPVCLVIFCCFTLKFPEDIWFGASFHNLFALSRSFVGRCVFRSFMYFFLIGLFSNSIIFPVALFLLLFLTQAGSYCSLDCLLLEGTLSFLDEPMYLSEWCSLWVLLNVSLSTSFCIQAAALLAYPRQEQESRM